MKLNSPFFGTSTALRVFASTAMGFVFGGWVLFALGWMGLCLASQLAAFVFGISSCCPFGGIATFGAVLNLISWLVYGMMMSAS